MNFFEHQDDANKNTLRLLALFTLAVLALIILTNLLVAAVFWGVGEHTVGSYPSYVNLDYAGDRSLSTYLTLDRFLQIALWVSGTIGLVILFKWLQLRGGGKVVAERMGGVRIGSDTSDLAERRLLNVVEEMAIASGLPVPPVYLMEEKGINAFAAGYRPGDAVIGITRGALLALDRDQLQGVIAHEFSHILHGDMRINMKLIAVLAGILFIGQAGYMVLRGSGHARSKNGAPLVLLGAGLLALGYIGVFFGNLIKAGVSRQREYLADASAVQYTRNPDGIGNALKIIGGSTHGSVLNTSKAEENCHLFFGSALTRKASSLLATHPPLESRIRRIQPDWDGKFIAPKLPDPDHSETTPKSSATGAKTPLANLSLAEHISNSSLLYDTALKNSQGVLSSMPKILRAASQETMYAQALIFALLLEPNDKEVRQQQVTLLEESAGLRQRTEQLWPVVLKLPADQRLPLVELSVPALKQQSPHQHQAFQQLLHRFIDTDQTISLFEWMLQRLLQHYLNGEFGVADNSPMRTSLRSLDIECFEVLSLLAYRGHGNFHDAEHAYLQSIFVLELGPANLVDEYTLNNERLDRALTRLNTLKPTLKQKFLKACAVCIEADKKVTATESELLRVIAALLDCPMPALKVMRM